MIVPFFECYIQIGPKAQPFFQSFPEEVRWFYASAFLAAVARGGATTPEDVLFMVRNNIDTLRSIFPDGLISQVGASEMRSWADALGTATEVDPQAYACAQFFCENFRCSE